MLVAPDFEKVAQENIIAHTVLSHELFPHGGDTNNSSLDLLTEVGTQGERAVIV